MNTDDGKLIKTALDYVWCGIGANYSGKRFSDRIDEIYTPFSKLINSMQQELTSLRQYKAEAESQSVFAMAFEKQGMRAPDDFEDYLDIIELEKVNPDELEAYQKHGRVFPLYACPVPAGSCAVPEDHIELVARLGAMIGWFEILAEKAGWNKDNAGSAFAGYEMAKSKYLSMLYAIPSNSEGE
jgi:hypothetical protein